MTEIILFWILAVLAVVPGILAITRRNPLDCAMYLIVVLASIAGLFWLLDSRVISILQVLIYAGAIVTLLIFVIMLLNLPPDSLPRDPLAPYWLSVLVIVAIGLRMSVLEPSDAEKPVIITYEQAARTIVTDDAETLQEGIQHLPAAARVERERAVFGTMRQISGRIFGEKSTLANGDSHFTLGPYLLPFEILSVLLLVAAIGAMILTKRHV